MQGEHNGLAMPWKIATGLVVLMALGTGAVAFMQFQRAEEDASLLATSQSELMTTKEQLATSQGELSATKEQLATVLDQAAQLEQLRSQPWSRNPVSKRIAILKQELQSFALNPTSQDVQAAGFSDYAEKVLWAILKAALSKRTDGQFVPLVRLFYKDTTPMITAGALLCPKETVSKFEPRFRAEFPFFGKRDAPYSIPPFNFTLRERHILDAIVTSEKLQKKQRNSMKKIGLTAKDIEDYKHMLRFVPKYFESYL